MWGAVIGDLAGSIYEYNQTLKFSKLKPQELIAENAFYSDDTILTMAILEAILDNGDYEFYLKKYAKEYGNYQPDFTPYFKTVFSPGFTKWANGEKNGISAGNGAMMRISAVGYLFDNKEDVIANAKLATIPSHNCEEAIKGASIVALIIYYARCGFSKDQIIKELNLNINYNDFNGFNLTCFTTIDNCLYALFNSESFEEAILKVISYGGDTDTNACIVGSMTEALYGIKPEIILKAQTKLPQEFKELLDRGYQKVKKLN